MTYCSVGVYSARRNVRADDMVPVIQDPSKATSYSKFQHEVIHADIAPMQGFAFVVSDLDNYVCREGVKARKLHASDTSSSYV